MALTHAELEGVLTKAKFLLLAANRGIDPSEIEERSSFESGSGEVTTESTSIGEIVNRLPSPITRFSYRYFARGGAIRSVVLSCSDYSRKLTVEGKSPDDVDTFIAAISERLLVYERMFGGKGVKLISGLLACAIFPPAFMALFFSGRKQYRLAGIGVLAAFVIGIFLVIILPVDVWLGGFLLFATEKNWLVLYAPQISLVGLLLAVVSCVLPFFPARKSEVAPPTIPAEVKPPEAKKQKTRSRAPRE